MARATWKFLWATHNDIEKFYSKIDEEFSYFDEVYRHKTINVLNMNQYYTIHQGKTKTTFPVMSKYIKKKLGMLSKTRKPFFFRSKKKKR